MHRYILGIDTGGTYTDAVVLSAQKGEVLASAKALTTRADLAVGIAQAVQGLGSIDRTSIALTCLSTTLATNAAVEGHGGRVCLLLVGYDKELIDRFGFRRDLVTDDVVYVEGGHDIYGQETCSLDEDVVRRTVAERDGSVDAYAVSGYLAVRNPAHERRVADLLKQLTDLPVCCGRELSEELNSIRRATTVTLNARLIPLLRDLVLAVRRALAHQGIHAPLALVRGNGSLASDQLGLQHPVETLLSGPAASVIGARHLAGRDDLVVVDMGGTTTDLAILSGGRPLTNNRGAWVGGWHTAVKAVDTRSVGLGGDSRVALDRGGELRIGPQRVVPLSLAAHETPSLVADLQRAQGAERQWPEGPEYLRLVGRPTPGNLSANESKLLELLAGGPTSLAEIAPRVYLSFPNRLETGGFIQRIGFTPTDALHVLGTWTPWNRQAALLGARLLCRPLRSTPEDLASHVRELVIERLAGEIVAQVAAHETGSNNLLKEAGSRFFLERALLPGSSSALDVRCQLRLPLAAIGAPVGAYFPEVARRLGTELLIPKLAGVGNAVGAASGSIVETVEVIVAPEYSSVGITGYRAHTPEERRQFDDLKTAVAYARATGRRLALDAAQRAGADEIVVEEERKDQRGTVDADFGASLYLGSRIRFTAVGRPRITGDDR